MRQIWSPALVDGKSNLLLQMRGEAVSVGPATWVVVQEDYCCVSAEASFSACFAADLLSAELIVGLSV